MTIDELGAIVLRLEARIDALVRAQPRGRLLSKSAAARYLGVSRGTTLGDLIASRAILTVKTPAGPRIALAELDRYLADGPRGKR